MCSLAYICVGDAVARQALSGSVAAPAASSIIMNQQLVQLALCLPLMCRVCGYARERDGRSTSPNYVCVHAAGVLMLVLRAGGGRHDRARQGSLVTCLCMHKLRPRMWLAVSMRHHSSLLKSYSSARDTPSPTVRALVVICCRFDIQRVGCIIAPTLSVVSASTIMVAHDPLVTLLFTVESAVRRVVRDKPRELQASDRCRSRARDRLCCHSTVQLYVGLCAFASVV